MRRKNWRVGKMNRAGHSCSLAHSGLGPVNNIGLIGKAQVDGNCFVWRPHAKRGAIGDERSAHQCIWGDMFLSDDYARLYRFRGCFGGNGGATC